MIKEVQVKIVEETENHLHFLLLLKCLQPDVLPKLWLQVIQQKWALSNAAWAWIDGK